MDGYSLFATIAVITAFGAIYRLDKRVKELEEPIKQEKRNKLMITKAEVLKLIEESKKG